MHRQCATTAIPAMQAAPTVLAMAAMLGRLVAQLKMPPPDLTKPRSLPEESPAEWPSNAPTQEQQEKGRLEQSPGRPQIRPIGPPYPLQGQGRSDQQTQPPKMSPTPTPGVSWKFFSTMSARPS
jgi:hypothetical protein